MPQKVRLSQIVRVARMLQDCFWCVAGACGEMSGRSAELASSQNYWICRATTDDVNWM